MGGDNSDLKSIVYYIVVPVAYANWDLQYGGSGSCDLAAFRLSHGQSWDLGAYFDSDKLEVGGDNSNLESIMYTIGVPMASANGDPEYEDTCEKSFSRVSP